MEENKSGKTNDLKNNTGNTVLGISGDKGAAGPLGFTGSTLDINDYMNMKSNGNHSQSLGDYRQPLYNKDFGSITVSLSNKISVLSKTYTASSSKYKLNHDVIFKLQIYHLYPSCVTYTTTGSAYSIELSAFYNKKEYREKKDFIKDVFTEEKLFADLLLIEIQTMKSKIISEMQKVKFTSYLEDSLENLF